MSDVTKIIDLFGGQSEMKRKLGHKNPTTIASWKKAGRIPPWRILEIEVAAKAHSVKLPKNFTTPPKQEEQAQ